MGIPGSANPMLLGGAAGYEIEQSLRFNSADSAYLNRTPSSAGNRKTWTWSSWVKLGKGLAEGALFGAKSGTPQTSVRAGTQGNWQVYGSNASIDNVNLRTDAIYRDPSAWYHALFSFDANTTNLDIYVNGVAQSTTVVSTILNEDHAINNTIPHTIGTRPGLSDYFEGYMAEVHFVDGQALNPTDFGEYDDNGVWRPIEYTGSYGTNGFYLKFDPSATNGIGHDHSGNGNNFTANNFTTSGTGTDVMSDTPTTNWCTLNAASPLASGTLSNGNLNFSTGNADAIAVGTMAVSTGKWYWEITATTVNASKSAIGIIGQPPASLTNDLRVPSNGYCYISDGNKGNNNTTSAYGATYTSADVIGVALDLDAGTLVFYKNNSTQGTAYSSLSGTFSPAISDLLGGGGGAVFDCNFGQHAFAYTPPTGYKALNTANLPAPDIADGSKHFNTVLYTGTSSTQSITGVNFQPDFTWVKRRDSTNSHALFDAVRGAGERVSSNETTAEIDNTTYFTSFDSDGFSVASNGGETNLSGATYVAWNWKAGGSGSTNTAGTVTSTVSANPTAGFSIVSYDSDPSGVTVGHGLGVAPKLIIEKKRDVVGGWLVTTNVIDGSLDYLRLDAQFAAASAVISAPTSTVFSPNASSDSMIAYCFAEVEGYSKIGSYTGNGSSDGPFVYCGFRPAWVMVKCSSTGTTNWVIWDSERGTYNPVGNTLSANLTNTEGSGNNIDMLSNGFKLREVSPSYNTTGSTYIYVAFAEHPFGGSNVLPATAR